MNSIGTTSQFGKHRLTMAGVEERYKIKGSTVLSWLNNYQNNQIQSAIDIVNGMYILYYLFIYNIILLKRNFNHSTLDFFVAGIDSPVKIKVSSEGNKAAKRNAAADNYILSYPVKVEKIDIH